MNGLPHIFAATCTNMFSKKILCHAHARKAPACLPHSRSNARTFHVNSPRLTPYLMLPISETQCKHPIPLGARYNPQNAPILIFLINSQGLPASPSCPYSSSASSVMAPSSSQSSDSRLSARMPKLAKKPTNAIPPKTPHANASPLGRIVVEMENRPPDMKGPTALPAAESVCARPLSVPGAEWLGAEWVIWGRG
jgi:hypothetical protein